MKLESILAEKVIRRHVAAGNNNNGILLFWLQKLMRTADIICGEEHRVVDDLVVVRDIKSELRIYIDAQLDFGASAEQILELFLYQISNQCLAFFVFGPDIKIV